MDGSRLRDTGIRHARIRSFPRASLDNDIRYMRVPTGMDIHHRSRMDWFPASDDDISYLVDLYRNVDGSRIRLAEQKGIRAISMRIFWGAFPLILRDSFGARSATSAL